METHAHLRSARSRSRFRASSVLPLFALFAAGCGGSEPAEEAQDAEPAQDTTAQEVVRTANPAARGLTATDFPRIQEVAPGVYTYEQLRGAGDETFTTVSMFVVTTDGVLVADGQGSVEETRLLIDHIGQVTDQPITHVVIGSDHGDHTAGNSAFPADAEYLATAFSAGQLETQAENQEEGAAPFPLATQIVADSTMLALGDKEVHVLFLGRAHTGGDLVVYLPQDRIMFMSETFMNRVFPAMRSALPTEWVAMLDRAKSYDVELYVPGHGFVDSPEILREELDTYQQALQTVIDEATRLHEEGLSLEEAQAQADMGELETWSLVSSQKARAIQQVYAELDGELN